MTFCKNEHIIYLQKDIIFTGVMIMATKSITKNITIREKNLGKGLIYALENAKNKSCQEVNLSKKHQELTKEEILGMFKKA